MDPVAEPFIREVIAWLRHIPACEDCDAEETKLSRFCGQVTRYIRRAVSRCLDQSVEPKGLDLVKDLAGRARSDGCNPKRLDICTLNHDLLLEKVLGEAGKDYIDGFGKSNGDFRPFYPSVYEKPDPRVRLFKLHGSINWHYWTKLTPQPRPLGIPDPCGHQNNSVHSYTVGGTWRRDDLPLILAGTGNKAKDYHDRWEYAEMMYWFHRLLLENDTVVMSGCSLSDDEIRGQFWGWFNRRGNTRLVLLHKEDEPPEGVRQVITENDGSSKSGFTHHRQWLCCTSVKDLKKALS